MDVFVAAIDKASPWAINLMILVFTIIGGVFLIVATFTLKKNLISHEKLERLIDLREAYDKSESEKRKFEEKFKQERVVLEGIKTSLVE